MKKNIIIFILGMLVCFLILNSTGLIKKDTSTNLERDIDSDIKWYKSQYLSLLREKAHNEFVSRNYENALKYAKAYKEKQRFLDEKETGYDKTISCLSKLVEIEEKIKKNPKDYNLYFKRAEILDHPYNTLFLNETNFCADARSAFLDYSKVIELNPKMKLAYEKRADARYMSMDPHAVENGNSKLDQKTIKENAKKNAEDYLTAIKLNGTSDRLNIKLAHSYYDSGEYNMSLGILNTIPFDDIDAILGRISCYEKLKNNNAVVLNVDKALSVLAKQKKESFEDAILRKNLYMTRAKANLKGGYYIRARRDYKKSKSIVPINCGNAPCTNDRGTTILILELFG